MDFILNMHHCQEKEGIFYNNIAEYLDSGMPNMLLYQQFPSKVVQGMNACFSQRITVLSKSKRRERQGSIIYKAHFIHRAAQYALH